MKLTIPNIKLIRKVKNYPKIVALVSGLVILLPLASVLAKNISVAEKVDTESPTAKVLSVSNDATPKLTEETTSTPTPQAPETNNSANDSISPSPAPTATPVSNTNSTGGSETTPSQTSEPYSNEFNATLSVIGLLDGDANCRETKVTSSKIITDYTYVSGSDVSGGGSPQSSSFIFGICKKSGVYDYYLTLYSSDGDKKVIHEFFSSWPPASSFPTPTPTETPTHDPLQASWDTQTIHTGEVKELACDSKGCFKSDAYQQVTITANAQLKSCQVKTNGFSSPGGSISVSSSNKEGQVENNICTYSTSIGYTVKGAKIESIYGETMTFGDW